MSREAWPYNPKTLLSFLEACLIRFHLDACHSFTPLSHVRSVSRESKTRPSMAGLSKNAESALIALLVTPSLAAIAAWYHLIPSRTQK
jgi:hypothetical protein